MFTSFDVLSAVGEDSIFTATIGTPLPFAFAFVLPLPLGGGAGLPNMRDNGASSSSSSSSTSASSEGLSAALDGVLAVGVPRADVQEAGAALLLAVLRPSSSAVRALVLTMLPKVSSVASSAKS